MPTLTKEATFESAKGAQIFVRSWHPSAAPHAVVVICHGVNSHGGQYTWVGEQLVAGGFAAYALDLRGRGRSDGERFYVEDVADYVSDVAGTVEMAKARYPGLPLFLLGHSAGASYRAYTRWRINVSSPASFAKALRFRSRRRASYWLPSRASATSRRAYRC